MNQQMPDKDKNKMRKLTRWIALLGFAFGLVAVNPVPAVAQGAPVAELGVDYNYVRTNAPPDGCGCFSMHGGNGWFAYNFSRGFGVVAEVSSQRASDISGSGEDLTLTSYLFGPRYSWRKSEHFAPFGQVLVGGAHASGSFSLDSSGFPGSSNAFAMIAGGGLDIGVARHFAVRAFEADYYLTHFANGFNDRQNNLRISAGVIFRFGEK